MINAELTKASKEECKEFPALYESLKNEGKVILFFSACEGVVVKPSNNQYHIDHDKIGKFNDSWTRCDNNTVWHKLPKDSEIKLTQG